MRQVNLELSSSSYPVRVIRFSSYPLPDNSTCLMQSSYPPADNSVLMFDSSYPPSDNSMLMFDSSYPTADNSNLIYHIANHRIGQLDRLKLFELSASG